MDLGERLELIEGSERIFPCSPIVVGLHGTSDCSLLGLSDLVGLILVFGPDLFNKLGFQGDGQTVHFAVNLMIAVH